MSRTRNFTAVLACLAALTVGAAGPARTDPFHFTVSLDTTGLPALSGDYAVYLALTDGGGIAANQIDFTSFGFGGGSPTGSPVNTGGSVGDLWGTVTLNDSSFLNEFSQTFSLGSEVVFDVDLADVSVDSPSPDTLLFCLLDDAGMPIATTDPNGFALFVLELSSSSLHVGDVQAFGYEAGGHLYNVRITQEQAGVPEPGPAAVLLSLGSVAAILTARRRAR